MKSKLESLQIREETPLDYPSVYTLNYTTFGRKEEAQLVDRIRSTEHFIPQLSLVATIENKIVGYAMFSEISIANNENVTGTLSLAPIAVLPEWQKMGIGHKLIKNGLKKAQSLGYKSAIVLGHEEYYPRFGFEPTIRWNIKPPFAVPENIFMGIELCEGAFENAQGTVIYPKAFEEV